MPILKILPDAISNTASYVFGNVTTTSITAGGTDLKTLAQSAYDAANAAGSSATVTAAFEQANVTAGGLITANSRITISEGVDVGQNTRTVDSPTPLNAAPMYPGALVLPPVIVAVDVNVPLIVAPAIVGVFTVGDVRVLEARVCAPPVLL